MTCQLGALVFPVVHSFWTDQTHTSMILWEVFFFFWMLPLRGEPGLPGRPSFCLFETVSLRWYRFVSPNQKQVGPCCIALNRFQHSFCMASMQQAVFLILPRLAVNPASIFIKAWVTTHGTVWVPVWRCSMSACIASFRTVNINYFFSGSTPWSDHVRAK